MLNVYEVLDKKDIEEKFQINQKDWGYTAIQFKEKLEDELFGFERLLLEIKGGMYKNKIVDAYKLMDETLHIEIQICNLKEQIAYMNNKILKEIQCPQVTHQA